MAYNGIWDGFDDYNGSTEVWTSGSASYSTAYARFAAAAGCVGQGMKLGGSASKTQNLKTNVNVLIFGFAVQFAAMPASGGPLIQAIDNTGGHSQWEFWVLPSGAMQFNHGSGGVLGATGPGIFSPGVWHWIDIEVSIGSSGSCLLYVDTIAGGAPLLSLSGVNTQVTGNAWATTIKIGDPLSQLDVATYWDDFHCHDNTGSAPNSVLGAGTRIYTKMPNGAGALTNWTANGASANWQCVDDVPPDDDTTYVSAASSIEDNYAVGAASLSGVINGLVRRSLVRMDDAGPHTFQNGVRSGGVDQFGVAQNVSSSYAYLDGFSGTDPNTSAAWLAAGADAATPIIYRAS